MKPTRECPARSEATFGCTFAERDRYTLTGPLSGLSIPATLQELLMARLDRLPTVREVAQLGAVLGREFAYEMLRALGVIGEPTLSDGLVRLVEAELLYQSGQPPKARYVFKHALVQDAAYQSLLKRTRQHYHRQVAALLETSFPEVVEAQPELLAHHHAEAGSASEAVSHLQRAGEKAVQRSANVEAIAQLSKGLELIGTLPNAEEHLDEELALQLAIGGPLIAIKSYAAPEVERTYSRAWALCDQLGRSAELFPVLWGLWHHYLVRGQLERDHDLAKRIIVLAEEDGAPLRRALARRALGTTLFYLGRFTDAIGELSEGIVLDDTVADWENAAHLLFYTERAGVACRLYSREPSGSSASPTVNLTRAKIFGARFMSVVRVNRGKPENMRDTRYGIFSSPNSGSLAI